MDETKMHDAGNCQGRQMVAVSECAYNPQGTPKEADDTRTERFRPPCECEYCQLQYGNHRSTCGIDLFYIGHFERETITARAYEYMNYTRKIIEKMRLMVETNGELLADIWCSNRRVRKEILLRVHESLYPTRSPLLHQLSSVSDLREEDVYKNMLTWLLPYLNIENLVEDASNLPKLIHHRINSEPADWVPFDNVQLYEAWRHGLVPESSAEGCIKMYGKEMGTWQPFNSDEVHRAEAYGAPRALLILTAQFSLLAFLRMLMTEILESSNPGKKTDSAASVGKSASDSAITVEGKWTKIINAGQTITKSSFGAVFAKQPFAVPPRFDIDVLLEIAESQVAEAHDELWLRQTDPEYFMEVARRYNAQAPHHHPGIKKMGFYGKNDEMNYLARFMTLNSVNHWRDWQCILEECQAVKQKMDACEQPICLGKPLPSEIERTLGYLSAMINKFRQKGRKELALRFVMSVPFSYGYVCDGTRPRTHHYWDVGDGKRLFQEDPVGWCIWRLSDQPQGVPEFDCSLTFQLLDEALRCRSRKELERIDHEIYRFLSDNLALEQMWNLLQYHRPQFRLPDGIDFSRESSQGWQTISKLDETKPLVMTMDQIGAAMSFLSKSRMPQGSRNAEWVAQRDVAHRALSNLWKAASDYHGTCLTHAKVPQKYVDTQLELMRLGDSPENQTQLAVEKQTVVDRLEAARECSEAEKTPICVEESPPILYRIKMKAKVWKVINAIFPDPELDREESNQKVDWSEFLSAMATLEFKAVNRGGSAFIFSGQIMLPGSPSTQKRSICVHSPHPSTEMSPILLRSLGKRFHRKFGWQRANFLAIDNPSPLKSCAVCRVARYCSRDCQKADWSSHRTVCETLALEKAGSPPPGSDCEVSLRPDGQYRCEHCEQ